MWLHYHPQSPTKNNLYVYFIRSKLRIANECALGLLSSPTRVCNIKSTNATLSKWTIPGVIVASIDKERKLHTKHFLLSKRVITGDWSKEQEKNICTSVIKSGRIDCWRADSVPFFPWPEQHTWNRQYCHKGRNSNEEWQKLYRSAII